MKGLLFTVQKALPLIPNAGSILLNASIESKQVKPAFSVYSATKAAVRSFARGWTTDLKDRHIRVNVISPGPIETPGLNGLAGATTAEQLRGFHDHLGAEIPLGRVGGPEEVARVAVFLASDDASFVAGVGVLNGTDVSFSVGSVMEKRVRLQENNTGRLADLADAAEAMTVYRIKIRPGYHVPRVPSTKCLYTCRRRKPIGKVAISISCLL